MKKIIFVLGAIALALSGSHAQEGLQINTAESSLKWMGEYTFYFGGHEGFIGLKEGELIMTNGEITGGHFVIDMNSISNTDITIEDAKKSLVDHLKSKDFFNVKEYPESRLVITGISYSDKTHAEIEAVLTIKNISKSIRFRAEMDPDKKEINTKFKIDRNDWGVNFNYMLKDEAISDAIGFHINLIYQ
ncbi:MAG TPA: YceI family protein [Saprospiraceae bacterium]|nr:YceI family protein [Saprospiraceae bacterium]HQU51777.1 YceI family protein [Saprospiraceae bacterium]HRV85764.1 YceI family protein [Saprospiraceae bacterium]